MYERLLDKNVAPSAVTIQEYLGPQSYKRLTTFESLLQTSYHLVRELKFPFGNTYGWGYKYSHKLTHLCYVFFEKDAFLVMLQIGDKQFHCWKINYRYYYKKLGSYGKIVILVVNMVVGFIIGF